MPGRPGAGALDGPYREDAAAKQRDTILPFRGGVGTMAGGQLQAFTPAAIAYADEDAGIPYTGQ